MIDHTTEATLTLALFYVSNVWTANISSAVRAVYHPGGLGCKSSRPPGSVLQILLNPYAREGIVTFFICVAPAIHGKIGKKSWKQWNQEFILFCQRVNVRAELLLCYTLLGLERTSWSPAHIFHSLACSLTWAACISAATKSCDRLTSVEIALHIAPIGLSDSSLQIKHPPTASFSNVCFSLSLH